MLGPSENQPSGSLFCDLFGAVAQLVERVVRNDEVGSSTLLRSILKVFPANKPASESWPPKPSERPFPHPTVPHTTRLNRVAS